MIGLVKFIWFLICMLCVVINYYHGTWWGMLICFVGGFVILFYDD